MKALKTEVQKTDFEKKVINHDQISKCRFLPLIVLLLQTVAKKSLYTDRTDR